MNKLQNRQDAEHCLEDIKYLATDKISKTNVGLNFIYSDFLYLYSDKPAPELKHSFMNLVIDHRNSVQKLLEKNRLDFQIQHSFNYVVWNQLYVGTNDFYQRFDTLKKLYQEDVLFQKYIQEDCDVYGKEMKDNQVNYFLEEILMFYLLTKNQVMLPNDYIEGNQKWILFCYPGRPLKSTVYLYQLNPFKLDWPENPYQNAHFDLEANQLIEFDRVDLATYEVR